MADNSMRHRCGSGNERTDFATIESGAVAVQGTVSRWDFESVARFASGNDDILVLPRCEAANVRDFIEAGRVHEYWAIVRRETIARELRFGMNELHLRSVELTNDIVGLVKSFIDQFDIKQAKMRLEITRSQSCPNFHCDNEHVRMVTTYVGPTTEYQYAGEEGISTAPLHGLVFLKGRKHPMHRDTVFHRSPEVPAGEKRLCLAIDY